MAINPLTSEQTHIPTSYHRLPFCGLNDQDQPSNLDVASAWPTHRSPASAWRWLSAQTVAGSSDKNTNAVHDTPNSPYALRMKQDTYSQRLCQTKLTTADAKILRQRIADGYHHNWVIDALPTARISRTDDPSKVRMMYNGGFPMGHYNANDKYFYIHNHVNIHIVYRRPVSTFEFYNIVDVAVEPISINHNKPRNRISESTGRDGLTLPNIDSQDSYLHDKQHTHTQITNSTEMQRIAANETIVFTFDVIWRKPETSWQSPWRSPSSSIREMANAEQEASETWTRFCLCLAALAIFSSTCVVATMSSRSNMPVASHFMRNTATTNNAESDVISGNTKNIEDTGDEESRMTLDTDHELKSELDEARRTTREIHPPTHMPALFYAAVATGAQLTFSVLLILVACLVGMVDASDHASILNASLRLYSLCGLVGGYISHSLHHGFSGQGSWQSSAILTATLFPTTIILILGIADTMIRSHDLEMPSHSSFSATIAMGVVWFCATVVFVFVGSFLSISQAKAGYHLQIPRTNSWVTQADHYFAVRLISIVVRTTIPMVLICTETMRTALILGTKQYTVSLGYRFQICLAVFAFVKASCARAQEDLKAKDSQLEWIFFFTPGFCIAFGFVCCFLWLDAPHPSGSFIGYTFHFMYVLAIDLVATLMYGSTGILVSLWTMKTANALSKDK
eukprot:CAMPEP_0198114910 /NCGR_PEP_ID=MMETSP1442-20131203/6154_1 /TAXON_ID= /ORGANISM="Craspedostauros australis, Strain CCMP3328" /LENGTH=682 /DNA_ID=CAMNT_0043772319 /DNA_START=275 /DNA_END=2323 /DNA_ORIENTATION=-